MVLTFSHYPWQENLLIEALQQIDRGVPLLLNHKSQPGDWDPFRGRNNVMVAVPDREAMMLFDGVGEYWGQGQMPYCFPEEIQSRLQDALRHNRGINSVGMRVHWGFGYTLFGSFNEVNFYALSRLAKDPYLSIDRLWRDWAEKRFGKQAAPKMIEALRRSDQIGKRTFYFRGMWVQQHSRIADLPYLEAQVLHTGRSMIQWCPQNMEDNQLIDEFMYHPGERTIRVAIADRREALRLNRLSMADVESVKAMLPAAEYRLAVAQFTLQRHFVETSIPHIEAFLRYWIQRNTPSAENLAKLEPPLRALESKADEVARLYQEKLPLFTAQSIRTYVRQVREAVATLPPMRQSPMVKKLGQTAKSSTTGI